MNPVNGTLAFYVCLLASLECMSYLFEVKVLIYWLIDTANITLMISYYNISIILSYNHTNLFALPFLVTALNVIVILLKNMISFDIDVRLPNVPGAIIF